MRVLDVGCGTGGVSLAAARIVGPSGQVVGVDMNAQALETARWRSCGS
jgi:ubiquinone/menaquinone biosynthesis C-methylase UbiE